MPTIEANGETLSYTRSGPQKGEGPVIVLLHGVGANADLWAESVAQLSREYTLLAFDLRGHGGSTCNGDLTIPDMAQDIAGALEALGIDRFHLVGVSLGAEVAIHVAVSARDAVASLAVSGIGLVPDQALEDEVYGIQEAVHYLADEDFAEQIGEALLIPDAPQVGIEGLRGGIGTLGKRYYLAVLKAMVVSDLSDIAGSVTVPVLVLHGTLEELVPLEQARALADAISDASLREIEDAGHLANLDNPTAFGAALAAFLQTHQG